MDNIQEECYVGFTLRFTRIASKCKESIKILLSYRRDLSISKLVSTIFFLHDIFHLDVFHLKVRGVERIQGFVAIFILVGVYSVESCNINDLILEETSSIFVMKSRLSNFSIMPSFRINSVRKGK